jgi:hypothetical protein
MSQPDSILLAGMDGSALILPAEVLAALTRLAVDGLDGFDPRSFTLEDGPASGEEALALADLLSAGAVSAIHPWLSEVNNLGALTAFLHSCGGFRALLLN